MFNDPIGERMKAQYEDRTRYMLPRRTYTIIRLDGVAFHTFTKDFERPFDQRFVAAMSNAALAVGNAAQGFKLGYHQSDEISILLTDFADPKTAAWFDGNLQKIASVSASIASAHFNKFFMESEGVRPSKLGYFDARVFVIPDPVEVENYFIWRQKDAIRNSILSYGQSFFSHKEMHGKKVPDIHEMLHGIDKNWARDVSKSDKNGVVIWKSPGFRYLSADSALVFLEDRNWLSSQIPLQWEEKNLTTVGN